MPEHFRKRRGKGISKASIYKSSLRGSGEFSFLYRIHLYLHMKHILTLFFSSSVCFFSSFQHTKEYVLCFQNGG